MDLLEAILILGDYFSIFGLFLLNLSDLSLEYFNDGILYLLIEFIWMLLLVNLMNKYTRLFRLLLYLFR
jgi:hypothetical protein